MKAIDRIRQTRKKRLKQLVARYGSQGKLAGLLDVQQGYISRSTRSKPIGEEAARDIEESLGLSVGWLDIDPDESAKTTWPFSFSRKRWEQLGAEAQEELEVSILRMMSGIEEEIASKRHRA